MKIIVTGSCGFIGFHVTKKLLDLNYNVIGIDNINNYYDITLKKDRLKILKTYKKFFSINKYRTNYSLKKFLKNISQKLL